jgi:hypothetical protein
MKPAMKPTLTFFKRRRRGRHLRRRPLVEDRAGE